MNRLIRRAHPVDAPAIAALVQASFRAHIAPDWQQEAQDTFYSETTAEKLVAPITEATFAAVYEEQGHIRGVILLPRPNLVQLCFVATTHLRRGIGTSLWEAARTHLRQTFLRSRRSSSTHRHMRSRHTRQWAFSQSPSPTVGGAL